MLQVILEDFSIVNFLPETSDFVDEDGRPILGEYSYLFGEAAFDPNIKVEDAYPEELPLTAKVLGALHDHLKEAPNAHIVFFDLPPPLLSSVVWRLAFKMLEDRQTTEIPYLRDGILRHLKHFTLQLECPINLLQVPTKDTAVEFSFWLAAARLILGQYPRKIHDPANGPLVLKTD